MNSLAKNKQQFRPGVSNIRPLGQNRPSKDSNPAHWLVLENVKEKIHLRH